jgi:hypothetical protein
MGGGELACEYREKKRKEKNIFPNSKYIHSHRKQHP